MLEKGNYIMSRRNLIITSLLATALAAGVAQAGEAGKLVFVAGQARMANQPALLDSAVQEGDELSTGADGYLYIKTIDGGFLILRPNSRARITAYHIDKVNPANTRVKLELLSGVARSISGQSVKLARQNFRFNTPVAAIGVRGTDFIVYTDQETSRVAVVSGGVVVSGFAGHCGPEGGGPCEGGGSRELFAGESGMLLQVQRGQKMPQLLHSPAQSPDQTAPPRSDEPVGKPTVSLSMPQELNLDAQKGSSLIASVRPLSPSTDVDNAGKPPVTPPAVVPVEPPLVVAPPVVTPPVVVAPPLPNGPQEIFWGRWQAVAGVEPDAAANAKLNDGTFDSGHIVGSYVMKRLSATNFVMPREGTAAFTLSDSVATLQAEGRDAVVAKVSDGQLSVDFGARSFNTSLKVTSPEASMNVSGRGDITQKGQLYSSPGSGAIIQGYVGGVNAEQAGYIFKSASDPRLTAEGVTIWKR